MRVFILNKDPVKSATLLHPVHKRTLITEHLKILNLAVFKASGRSVYPLERFKKTDTHNYFVHRCAASKEFFEYLLDMTTAMVIQSYTNKYCKRFLKDLSILMMNSHHIKNLTPMYELSEVVDYCDAYNSLRFCKHHNFMVLTDIP
jgi:hypothetical protein